MEDTTIMNYLLIEILEILDTTGVGIEPYNSEDEAYFPVKVIWVPRTATPIIKLEPIVPLIDTIYIEGYTKHDLTPGLYRKFESKAPAIKYMFRKNQAAA